MARNDRNPNNNQNSLFKALTRIFSGPMVQRRTQTGRQLRRRQLDKYASKFRSTSGLQFKKSEYNPMNVMALNMISNRNRSERYVDFDQMEYTPEIASSLDIYADEMTTHSSLTPMLNIKCANEEIKFILHSLYYDILNVNSNLFGWARTMCKYGDFFLFLDIDEHMGIRNCIGLPSQEVERLEGEDPSNPNYIQFQWNSGGLTFENWQISHFRVLGNDKYAPYGTSALEPARRIWRQLCVAAGESVLTPYGIKAIETLKAGDPVFCYDSQTKETKETCVVARKYMGKQEVYNLRTNHRNVKVTDKHGMLVKDISGEFIYKQAKEICNTDQIPLVTHSGGDDIVGLFSDSEIFVSLNEQIEYNPAGIMSRIRNINCSSSSKNIHAFLRGYKRIPFADWKRVQSEFDISDKQTTRWSDGSKKVSLLSSQRTFLVDKQFARLFGFLLGDGWLGKNRVGFADGIDEEQNRFYRNLLEDISNSQAHITPPLKGNRGGQTNIFSKEFKEILECAGFETGAINKKVPAWIYSMSLESRRAFITGYFDADGGYSDGRATSISYRLLEGIRALAMMSGIPVNQIKKNREEGQCSDGSYRQASYRLYLNMNKVSWCDDVMFEKVLGFELVGEEDTYDIQVENELHNFIVEGMVSHNTLLEDAMMAYRIVRATERRVFKIDVGGIAPQEVEQYMQKVMTQMKRHQVVDPDTGRVDLRYNPMSIEEDYFIPVRGGQSSTTIDNLPGGQFTAAIEDVKYLRDKLFSALKVPQSYLSMGEGATEDKTTLAQKDIRFARTIQRLQRVIIAELEKIGIIHLFTLGFRGDDLLNFELFLNNPSKIAEMQELEHWKTKFDIAGSATDGYFSKRWVAEHLLGLSEEEYIRMQREMFHDRKFDASLEAVGQAAEGGGELGGDLGGDLDLGGGEEDLGDEEIDLGGDEGGEDEVLLAEPPGKRDDNATPKKRGPYRKDSTKTYRKGGRRKQMNNIATGEIGTLRKTFPGKVGFGGLDSLARGLMEEQKSDILEERKLFSTDFEIKSLIESLKKVDEDET